MNPCTRWAAVVGTGLTLSLGLVAPATAATASTAAPAAAAVAPALRVPAGFAAAQARVAGLTGITNPATSAVRRVVTPTACGPTDLTRYVAGLLPGLDPDQLTFVATSGILDFPTYDALLFGTAGDPAYALPKGYDHVLTRDFRDAQRFWDVHTSDIQLLAMHGSVLLDQARLTRLLTVLYGFSPADARDYASAVVAVVSQLPVLQGGDNPIFTLNAFAFSAQGSTNPLISQIPDKLVFGDGILRFFEHEGTSDVAPRAVLGHEFAHHVQYEDHLFASSLTGPEATRRTELMADAFGTYFATASRGLSLNAERVLVAEQTFFQVGDCQFTANGHHGTPEQRLRASTWGAGLADSQHSQGHVLPSLTVDRLFEAALPGFVAPTA